MPEVVHYVKLRRRVVIHRMETAECLTDRVFWAIILYSRCGPEPSPYVVKKDARGWIKRDDDNKEPIRGSYAYLTQMLGLDPSMRKNVINAVQRLVEQKSVYIQDNLLYPSDTPPVSQDSPPTTDTGGNTATATGGNIATTWNIAGILIRPDQLPTDPEANTAARQSLTELSTGFNDSLKTLRTGYRKVVRQGISEHSILIDKSRRREDKAAAAPEEKNTDAQEEPAAADPITQPPETQPSDSVEESVVQEALSTYGPTDRETARKVIRDSSKHFPEAEPVEIVQMIHSKASGRRGEVRTIIGLLVSIVPKGFEGYRRLPRQPSPRDVMEEQNIQIWRSWLVPGSDVSPEDREV